APSGPQGDSHATRYRDAVPSAAPSAESQPRPALSTITPNADAGPRGAQIAGDVVQRSFVPAPAASAMPQPLATVAPNVQTEAGPNGTSSGLLLTPPGGFDAFALPGGQAPQSAPNRVGGAGGLLP